MGGLPGIDTAIATPTEAGAMGAVGAFILAAGFGPLVADRSSGGQSAPRSESRPSGPATSWTVVSGLAAPAAVRPNWASAAL